MVTHTERPGDPPNNGGVALRDFFSMWLDRLEVFYDRRFQDLDAKTTLALAAADKAVTKAEIATEKRFEGVNEFRKTLADQASSLMNRGEALSKFENIQRDVASIDRAMQQMRERGSSVSGRDLERDQSRQDGATRQSWMVPMIVIGGIAAINLLLNLMPLLRR